MKNLKKVIIVIIAILLAWFLYYAATLKDDRIRITDKEVIDALRTSTKITTNFTSEEVNMDYKDELIDIIERSEPVTGMVNLEGTGLRINFYNKNNEIIYSIMYWEWENRIGIKAKEATILEKDVKRFKEIIGEKNT